MNVYDFDKTIYRYDSTAHFYLTMLIKHPIILKHLPTQLVGFFRYFIKNIEVTEMKKYFYSYLKSIKDIDKELEEFWDKNIDKVNEFYHHTHKDDDVVISASPYFMVEPACRRLNVTNLIASPVDKYTGEVLGPNCSKNQKVIEFEKKGFKLSDMEDFYSDSQKDVFLARLAKKAYFVVKGIPTDWVNLDE